MTNSVERERIDNVSLEQVPSELEDEQSSLRTYEILTYPADFTLEVLNDKYSRGQIAIPAFQRGFVWTQIQASKLIESFVLGLPVPAIFLYQDQRDNKLLVVDGQQRLRTIAYYFEGYFGEEQHGNRPVFRLNGLDDDSPIVGRTYDELKTSYEALFNKLNDAVLRAFVIKQLDPSDDTSIYHVFERLNTGGTLLHPQEIRNCIYHGSFNELLVDLNGNDAWRQIFGKQQSDKRQRDVELILRFLALFEEETAYEKPMKEFLNNYMKVHKDAPTILVQRYRKLFEGALQRVLKTLGPKPFRIRAGLNAAIFDSVVTAYAHHAGDDPSDLEERFQSLKSDTEYLEWVSSGTTDREVVLRRLKRARKTLFDIGN